ncbi:BOS complex subunit NOMO1-like [Styela clava]
MANFFSIVIAFMTIFFFEEAITDEILGCGGFVKSKVQIDFSKVEIRLLTREGIQKYQTECAPNNGYYMVPFVEKGDFVLKVHPPNGWSFDPMSIDLHVDGVNDPCSQGKDINFEFLGFTVTGQVTSPGVSNNGPQDVNLTLLTQKENKVIATTTSSTGGAFQFSSVFPGIYKIQASHQSFTFKQNEIQVTVAQANVQCASSIVVSGYDVHGKVSAAQLPVKDVHMLLFSNKQLSEKVKGCSSSPPVGSDNIIKARKLVFLCSATSDNKGSFVFPNLPPQDYVVVPFHKAEHIEFDVEPEEMKFTVSIGSVFLDKTFQVTGFSVTGLVRDTVGGNPVANAQVLVNGKQQAVTNEKGLYRLQHMNSGIYKITLEKEDIFFPESSVRVGSDTPRLPDIVANKFSLCGNVEINVKPTKPFKIEQLSVSISNKNGENKIVEKLNKDASFCFRVSPGEYNVVPVVPQGIATWGIVLSPDVHKVTVKNKPIKNIKFNQLVANLKVMLHCIGSCHGVSVEMVMDGDTQKSSQRVSSKTKENTANLVFKDVLPNQYSLKAIHEDWCWETNQTTIFVSGDKKEENVAEFKQFGFRLTCSISHDLDMAIHHDGILVDTFALKKGRNQLCLAKPGKYKLEARSCHKFEQQSVIYETGHPQPVVMQAVNHEMKLRVESTHADKLLKFVIKSNAESQDTILKPSVMKEKNSESYIYSSQYLAKDNEQLVITPTSETLLFDPKSVNVVVKAEDCDKDMAVFKAFKGLFIEGTITPSIEDVDITVTAQDETQKTSLIKTDKNGKYRVGPLNPRVKYSISAVKEEYVFIQDTNKQENFEAKKLSKIDFKVKMKDGEQQPLSGVLITISGGSYRSNNLTDEEGNLSLKKLEPGQYYFKAVMKEYEFQPSSQVIDLKQGDQLTIEVKGKRVAFSCFGMVTSLNGQPESDVTVQAFSISENVDHAEEANSDEQGHFRIKGLLPGTKYEVKVKKSELFDRMSPSQVSINIKDGDVKDVRFIAFRTSSQFELSGNVVTNNEFLRYLKVVLYQSSDLSTPVHSASLSSSPFFHLPSLLQDDKEYHIRLETNLDKSRYTYTEPAAGFFATGTYKHITFQFHPEMKAVEPDTPQASYITLPLTLIFILLAYNHTKVLPWLQQLSDRVYSTYFNGRRDGSESTQTKQTGRKARKDK